MAGKTGHQDVLQNPDVERFLTTCQNSPRPDEQSVEQLFGQCPRASDFTGPLPEIILALDGSAYEASADAREPSRRVGYIKVGMVGLNMRAYHALERPNCPYIDPMAVNRLQRNRAISLALPGAYLKSASDFTPTEAYRREIQHYLASDATCIEATTVTMLDTLIIMMRYLDSVETHEDKEYLVFRSLRQGSSACPNLYCDQQEILVPLDTKEALCPRCRTRVFAADALRVYECFADTASNEQSYNRLMLALEHLLAAHYIAHLRKNNLKLLSELCIVMDGPLSISGEAAKLHRAMMLLLDDVHEDLIAENLPPFMMMGLNKQGRSVEHFDLIADRIPNDRVFVIDDNYRSNYITGKRREDDDTPFGDEIYYGQDMLVKTPRGHQFVICLPYPWGNKKLPGFKNHRFDARRYKTLGSVIEIVKTFETDLYENSMVPVILAHEYASISLTPGGKVLDLATARAVGA